MNDQSPQDQDKFRRYRARKKAAGLKEYRVWVPRWDTPEFQAEMQRAASYFEELGQTRDVAEFGEECLADFVRVIDAKESRKGS